MTMTDTDVSGREMRDQVIAQCRAVAWLASALSQVHSDYAKLMAEPGSDPILRQVGERTARFMEEIADWLNGMDAVSQEGEWLDPIFREAHRLFPQVRLRSPVSAPVSDVNAELVAALKPFAAAFEKARDKYAKRYRDHELGYRNFDKMPDEWAMDSLEFNMGAFRAARAALSAAAATSAPTPAPVSGERPVRVTRNWSDAKFGNCDACGQRARIVDDGEGVMICAPCSDAGYLSDWQDYARNLEEKITALRAPHGLPGEALKFRKEHYGATVATLIDTEDTVVEILARSDGDYELIVHNREGERDTFRDCSALLKPKHFAALGTLANRLSPTEGEGK